MDKNLMNLKLYKALFFHSPDLAYVIDKNCSLIDCNQHFLQHTGITALFKKNVGSLYQSMNQAGYWAETKIQTMKKKDIEVILSAEPLLDEPEMIVIDQKKTMYHYLVSRIPIFDANKQVAALLVQLKDVTDLKIMEDQLDKIKRELAKFNLSTEQPLLPVNSYELPKKPLQILVVEDNETAQKAAQGLLMQLDCLVDVIKTEEELQTIYKPGKYDLVLMDIELEGTTGYIFAKKIRQQEKNTKNHVPIIALTGFNTEAVSADCKYSDIEGAITKPLTLLQARQLIQHYILQIDMPVTGLRETAS